MEIAESLPKMLPGAVCVQWKRCGKSACRCAAGKEHGPYFYRFFREAGRLRKAYVRKADLDRVRLQCLARRQELERRKAARLDLRELIALLRELEQQP